MTEINRGRRNLLGQAAMAMAAGQLGMLAPAQAAGGESRELAALDRAADWLNAPRLRAADLRGKVVVVDFCTYTCINWLRTLPYRRAWATKYRPGLVLIGVHTPEFGFERDLDNVRRAMLTLGIDHPVVVDNDYAIWRAFKNRYWPALYVIDGRGTLRHQHFGEGEYEQSELVIQRLLEEAGRTSSSQGIVSVEGSGVEAPADWVNLRSSEAYLGYDRSGNFASSSGITSDRPATYVVPSRLALNQWALGGAWTVSGQAAVSSGDGGRVAFRFHARDVHLVMGPPRAGGTVAFRVSIDGQPPGAAHGLDIEADGSGTVVAPRLYQLVRQPGPMVDRTFEIAFLGAGVETYAFTFG